MAGALRRLGLIVNPKAGIGGAVGLKGSDGAAIQAQALALGAVPVALGRAVYALQPLTPLRDELEITTYPGEMGADAALICGFAPVVIGVITPGRTTAEDTYRAAVEMAARGTDLLLFAGGDGTARDILRAIGSSLPVLGIPAGVKIYSAAYANSPRSAGYLAARYLRGEVTELREVEVVDIDEEEVRRGVVAVALCGYLKIPFRRSLVQGLKSASQPGERAAADAIASAIVEQMADGWLYILGPGTTTRAITDRLGLPKTLIGVDLVLDREMVAADVNERQLLEWLERRKAKVVVTPIGGQGYLFGRGNQQISAEVLRRVGKQNIIVVSTPDKIASLRGRPFLLDTGSRDVDEMLSGYLRVVIDYKEQAVYRVSA